MSKKSLEPLLWTLFSAGGVVTALVLPIHILLFGVLIPLGVLATRGGSYLGPLVRHPVTCVYLFVVCVLALFHAAHRFRFTLYDGLQIKHLNELIAVFCYGGAIAGSVWAGYLLWPF
jgi:fumarate reductase subunit D